jgi:hypothetical protein
MNINRCCVVLAMFIVAILSKNINANSSNVNEYGGMEIITTVPTEVNENATVMVKDAYEHVVGYTTAGYLLIDQLSPGKYEVSFGDIANLKTPSNKTIDVIAGQIHGPIFESYGHMPGEIKVTYHTDSLKTRLERIRFNLVFKESV